MRLLLSSKMHFKISCSAWGHSSRDVETCHVTWLLTATSGALSPATALFQILQQKWTFSVSLDSRQQHFHGCRWVWAEIHLLCLSIVKCLPNSYRPSSLHGGSLICQLYVRGDSDLSGDIWQFHHLKKIPRGHFSPSPLPLPPSGTADLLSPLEI